MKKKLLLLLITVVVPLIASAYDAQINGLYYNLDSNTQTAEVTKGDYKVTGDITIPESISYNADTYTVVSIGDNAFEYCGKLYSISIPSTVKRIGKKAFRHCLELKSINIPSSVSTIESAAFDYCWNLESIDIPSSVSTIGNGAFSECWKLKSIVIPNSVTFIDNSVFVNCHGLESVTLPASITKIGDFAFMGCSSLDSIIIPSTVNAIGTGAFNGCRKLSSISMPETIDSIGGGAFKETAWLTNQPNGMVYIGKVAYCYKGTMADNTSLALKDGIVQISGYAFQDCKGLISIQIPETVNSIGMGAFYECSNLQSIKLPVQVDRIEDWTFYQCTNLQTVDFPKALTYIGGDAFCLCGKLKNVVFPDKLKEIDSCAFWNCRSLDEIVIPSSVLKINDNAFLNACNNVKRIIVSTSNLVYDSRNDCNAIIETSTNKLLVGCRNSFIPMGVDSISNSAFYRISTLDSILIPPSVKSIGDNAFQECSSLATVVLNEGIESIGEQSFNSCSSLINITIPSTVKSIGKYAFSGSNLTSITSRIEEPFPIYGSVFYPVYSTATLYVPSGTKSKYESTTEWNQFDNIVEITKKCDLPTIEYENDILKYNCTTVGAECVSTINDSDVKGHIGNEIKIAATYLIKVYATAIGYANSDIATATLCWIDSEPRTEGITNSVAQVKANAVLIQNNGGAITIRGVDDGTSISAYSVSGQLIGNSKASNNSATINTSLKRGETAILKIGNQGVKLLLR